MRRIVLAAATALVLSGCGGGGTLTQAQVDAMSDEEAMELLTCQGEQVVQEMGQEAGTEYMAELMMGPSDDPEEQMEFLEKNPGALQVDLWEDGYTCPELVP